MPSIFSRTVVLATVVLTIGCGQSNKANPATVTAEQEREVQEARRKTDQEEGAIAKQMSGGKGQTGYVNPEEAAFRKGKTR